MIAAVSDIEKTPYLSGLFACLYITRRAVFGPFALAACPHFGEIAAPEQDLTMSQQPSSTASRQIVWPSVITVISAAILIGAEVFGAAFAGGWALAILFGLDDTGAHILQAVLFGLGVLVMVAFVRAAQRIEPFSRRA
jgi:hypothetical protein